jgi:homoserine kinase
MSGSECKPDRAQPSRMKKSAQFRVPSSTANLGAGFDALSLALDRYLRISVEPAKDLRIVASGLDHDRIPPNEKNLIYRVAETVAKKRGRALPSFHMKIVNEIPLARGMGSSAAAIIAGITIYEILSEETLNEQDLFRYAFEFEPHPDNLSAALYGGLVAAAAADDGTVLVSKLAVPEGLQGVVVIPAFALATEKARAVLPESYSRKDTVYNIQRSALTVAALTSGNWKLLRESMKDRVHQPYRAKLIPGLEEILELEFPGLAGIALSGAGPTVFALAELDSAHAVGAAISKVFAKHGIAATPHSVRIDTSGRFTESS